MIQTAKTGSWADVWHSQSPTDVVQILETDPLGGLSDLEAAERLAEFGRNQLAIRADDPWWRKLLGQFQDPVVVLLFIASAVSGGLGELADASAILAIVLLNGVIGFFQERHAEQAMAALRAMASPKARAIRGKRTLLLEAADLVPGDVFLIEAGDQVPADARLLEATNLSAQESAITGESEAVVKSATGVLPHETAVAERCNMVHLGSVIASGKGRAVVTSTGMSTEIGRISRLLAQQKSEPTPLQIQLRGLGRSLAVICFLVVSIIFVLQVVRGGSLLEAFLLAVSLAVAAVPEGLPAVVTVALALGLQRLVKRNALVRRLASVETLGAVSVICSDKTGTLTRNEMTLRSAVTATSVFRVTGTGYIPIGTFQEVAAISECTDHDDAIEPIASSVVERNLELQSLLMIGSICNDASLGAPAEPGRSWQVIGDPTEGALLIAALKGGIDPVSRKRAVVYELPFDSDRKAMSVALQTAAEITLYSKGAPETILQRCNRVFISGQIHPFDENRRRQMTAAIAELSANALRVLALAFRPSAPQRPVGDVETELVFVGLVGLQDPPREEAKTAIQLCNAAGIRPVMITGDHPATATAIAKALGLLRPGDKTLTGAELERLSDSDLLKEVTRISVYARTTPEHKMRIVRAWKSNGHVVAMTGDGVNDAPAVKAADIGIAMGIAGSDVTKEASAMILTDDNFASIVSAVEEGRGIYDNIQKAVAFLLSCNFGEILLMFVASLLGWPAPLLPVQLLWINLVTDGLPALALSFEPPEPGVMNRQPRDRSTPLLSSDLLRQTCLQAVLLAMVGLTAFHMSLRNHPGDVEKARAMTFCVIVYAELVRALAARSRRLPLYRLGLWTNPHLLLAVVVSGLLQISIAVVPFTERIFAVPVHSALEWGLILGLAWLPFTIIEVMKSARLQWATTNQREMKS